MQLYIIIYTSLQLLPQQQMPPQIIPSSSLDQSNKTVSSPIENYKNKSTLTIPSGSSSTSSKYLTNSNNLELIDITPPSTNSNNCNSPIIHTPRGGGDNNDLLDEIVHSLIAGAKRDVDDEESEIEEKVEEEYKQSEEVEDENEEEPGDITEERVEDGEDTGNKEREENINSDAATKATEQSDATNYYSRLQRISSMPITSTPTNAYYRLLVKRGPRGHILVTFTLLTVQWIYVYTPLMYKTVSTMLFKLHIYNPTILYERECQRQMELKYGPSRKKIKMGFTSKLFGTSSGKNSQAKAKSERQKLADMDATAKLRQLYKTIKSGSSGKLSEVKYRYLSLAFRMKYGLGHDYRIEKKPRIFMGEIVDSNGIISPVNLDGEVGVDGDLVAFSDDKALNEDGGEQECYANAEPCNQKQQRHPKREGIEDWVVMAFATKNTDTNRKQTEESMSSYSNIRAEVERDAILAAAWESHEAEQSLLVQIKKDNHCNSINQRAASRRKVGRDDNVSTLSSSSRGSNSGYDASKMFQSVMTRVGSNGRIFGAYPNDALPIDKCANEGGVIQLARRYGYGKWTSGYNNSEDKVQIFDEEDDVV